MKGIDIPFATHTACGVRTACMRSESVNCDSVFTATSGTHNRYEPFQSRLAHCQKPVHIVQSFQKDVSCPRGHLDVPHRVLQ